MQRQHIQPRGFTLLEVILHISVAVAVLYAASLFYNALVFNDTRNHARVEVEDSSTHTLRILTEAIRNAESVTTPALGSSSAQLVLEMEDGALDPTTITLVDGVIEMQEGAAAAIPISSSEVSVDTLEFSNRSRSATSSTVHIEFSARYRNPSGRSEPDYVENFYGNATTR